MVDPAVVQRMLEMDLHDLCSRTEVRYDEAGKAAVARVMMDVLAEVGDPEFANSITWIGPWAPDA